MSSPIGMEPPPRVGTYWIASEPEERRDGLLNLRRGVDSELTVEPEFYSCFETVVEVAADGSTIGSIGLATDRGPQTVHGQLADNGKGGSVAVSLLQADSTNWTGSTQTFRPIWSILGGHVEPHHPFRGVRLRISGYAPAPHASEKPQFGDAPPSDSDPSRLARAASSLTSGSARTHSPPSVSRSPVRRNRP